MRSLLSIYFKILFQFTFDRILCASRQAGLRLILSRYSFCLTLLRSLSSSLMNLFFPMLKIKINVSIKNCAKRVHHIKCLGNAWNNFLSKVYVKHKSYLNKLPKIHTTCLHFKNYVKYLPLHVLYVYMLYKIYLTIFFFFQGWMFYNIERLKRYIQLEKGKCLENVWKHI